MKGGIVMPTYVSLLRYTQQGIQNMKDSPNRLETAKKMFKEMGGELKEFYLALGRYDAVVISEVPDGETAAKIILTIGGVGAVRTETFRVFEEDEYRRIFADLP